MNLNQVTLPAINMEESEAFYRALGFRKIVSDEHYMRFECPEGDATFSIERMEGVPAGPAVTVYFETEDLPKICNALTEKGIEFTSPPTDEPWLWSEARLKDPCGNSICIYSAGLNRKYPPWRIDA